MTVKAHEVLEAGVKHMQDRAATYDKPDGERSMEATVDAFNVITGDGLMNTEERGWLFMNILKMVRSQQGGFKLDNYEDGAAYWGLAAEAAHKERVTVEWPTEERIEAIGQNGNDGAVYKKYRDLEKPWEWQVGDIAEVDRCGEILSGAISDISESDDGALIFQLVGVDGLFLSGAFNSVIEKSSPVYRDLEKPETWKRGDIVKLYEDVATIYVELDSVAPDFSLIYWVDKKDAMKACEIPAHIRNVQSVEARS